MRRILQFTIAFAAIGLGGCANTIQGGPDYSASGVASTKTSCAAADTGCIRNFVFARFKEIDSAYNSYRGELFFGTSTGNLLADVTVAGLGLAGSLVPGATLKAQLAAISAGIITTKSSINADILYNSSIVALISRMDADRAKAKVEILQSLASPEFGKSIYLSTDEADVDLKAYEESGKLADALLTINSNAGTALTDCTAKAKALTTAATTGTGTAALISTISAASKC